MNSLLYTVVQKSTHSFWYLSFLMYWRTWKVCNYFGPPCRYVVFGLCLWLNASQRYYNISMHWCLSPTYQVLYLSMITGISQTTLEPSSSTHSHLTTSFSSIADMYRLQRIIGVLGRGEQRHQWVIDESKQVLQFAMKGMTSVMLVVGQIKLLLDESVQAPWITTTTSL